MSWHGSHGKGAALTARMIRRWDAEQRNERTPAERRRAYRRTLIALAARLEEQR